MRATITTPVDEGAWSPDLSSIEDEIRDLDRRLGRIESPAEGKAY